MRALGKWIGGDYFFCVPTLLRLRARLGGLQRGFGAVCGQGPSAFDVRGRCESRCTEGTRGLKTTTEDMIR
jgi:hypothetical protein